MIGGRIEYSFKQFVEKNNSRYYLYYSKLGDWVEAFQGKTAVKLHDNGNEITASFNDTSVVLDYGEVVELSIILNKYLEQPNTVGKIQHLKIV